MIKICSKDENTKKRMIRSELPKPTCDMAKYISSLLPPHSRSTETYKIEKEQDLILEPTDIPVRFDVVSLFTKISLDESVDPLVAEL